MEKKIEKISHLKIEIEKLVLTPQEANKSLLKSTYISKIEEIVDKHQNFLATLLIVLLKFPLPVFFLWAWRL
jgi:hypothetical protein